MRRRFGFFLYLKMHLLAKAAIAVGGYAAWLGLRLLVLKRATRRCATVGPRWLARACADGAARFARAVGVRVASIGGDGHAGVDTSRPFMYVWHPHGFVAYTPSMILGGMAVRGLPHGREWFGTCAPLLFNLPLLGEHFTVTNARPVDRRSLEAMLARGGSIAIQPGGVKEQAATRHDQEQAFFPKKLGFVRLAIKHGTPLVPMYLFGENQLYRRVDGFEWLTRLIKKATGMTLPIVTAKWGLPQAGLLPIATDVHVRYGRPVDVGAPEPEPSDARVAALFEQYLAELQRLFAAHAAQCLPEDVAARGLRVTMI